MTPSERRDVSTFEALKALAHPRRQRILRQLAAGGPATSASLARALGLNTGATSYHLRELARHGFVEDSTVPDAHGRERWWRVVRQDLRFPPRSQQSEEVRPVVDEMNRLAFAADLEAYTRSQAQSGTEDDTGMDMPYSRGSIHVTPTELARFFEEYIALVNRYKRDGALPAGAREVQTRFIAFPTPHAEGADTAPDDATP
ncbi:ArsR/SmtB family transcription factor [Embleya sp. NBC_00896]|uniref:ArsR/SmtB family transcription factor n=1 Tax=Embleya sp. NBC_00896 TaxID=2975961 RepID=UPI003865A756|nr:helix-turn-helix domain-containing protein [Embleya sp. NBC_00896]